MHNKQDLLVRLTCFSWLITKALGYKVWIAQNRLYPVIPPFEFLEAVPPVVHLALFSFSLAGLFFLIVFPQKKILLITTLVIILASCFLDVLRWQPWEYKFVFFLLIFIVNRKNNKSLYSAIAFVLASVYVYSGLHKISGSFLNLVWEKIILRSLFGLSKATVLHYKLHYAGLLLAFIEVAGGVGLLFIKRKIVPVALLTGMHIFIIIMLLHSGAKYISIVPVWNTAMILFLVLFYFTDNFTFSLPVLWNRNKAVLLFWGILPALSFIGYWDNFLSSNLFSGNTKYMDVCINSTMHLEPLAPYFSNHDYRNICNGNARITLYKWALNETGVLPYPEDWYYKKFKAQWEKQYPDADAEFIIYKYPFQERIKVE